MKKLDDIKNKINLRKLTIINVQAMQYSDSDFYQMSFPLQSKR